MIEPVGFTGRQHIDLNSQKFYKSHPDLVPRNVYLAMGRVVNQKEVNRKIENFGEPFWVRAKNWFKYKIEDIFNRDKK